MHDLLATLQRLHFSVRAIRRMIDDVLLPGHPKKQNLLNEATAALRECSTASKSAKSLQSGSMDSEEKIK
jgi:hypothetical protein